MLMRILVAAAVVAVVVFGVLTWRQQSAKVEPEAMTEAQAPEESAPAGEMAMPGAPSRAPGEAGSADTPVGVDWVVPRKWVNQIGSGMRMATYVVPGADSKNDAECAVYHFPPGQGGSVDANLDRWSAEFEKIAKQDSKRRTINGLKLATLEITGNFSGHTMNTEDATGPRPSWGLLGAIVEGPNGNVILKLTGPATTVNSAKPAFEEMLSSLHTH